MKTRCFLQGTILIVFTLFISGSLFGQTTQSNSTYTLAVSSDKYESAMANLYELAMNKKISKNELRDLLRNTSENLDFWSSVLDVFKDQSDVDLSPIYKYIKEFNQTQNSNSNQKSSGYINMTYSEKLELLDQQFKEGKVSEANYTAQKEYLERMIQAEKDN